MTFFGSGDPVSRRLFEEIVGGEEDHQARSYSAIAHSIQRAELEANFVVSADNLTKIVEICRRLDSVPRGIELAVARLAVLGLRDLHLRLTDHFVLSGGGHDLPARKKTPLEGVGWSYNGLTRVEQTLLRRLPVFAGSYTLEDAEAVCVAEDFEQERLAEIPESLVHKSLVVVNRAGVTRYRVLEVARSYCLGRLSEFASWRAYLRSTPSVRKNRRGISKRLVSQERVSGFCLIPITSESAQPSATDPANLNRFNFLRTAQSDLRRLYGKAFKKSRDVALRNCCASPCR